MLTWISRFPQHSLSIPGRGSSLYVMNSYDVAVIGGGAAGLSAALVLTRARRQVVVIDAGQPRNAPAAHMQGFLSRDGMPPADLLRRRSRRGRLLRRPLLVDDSVTGIVRAYDGTFGVLLASGEPLIARRLLVATGLRDEVVDIAGVCRAVGQGRPALPLLPRSRGPRPSHSASSAATRWPSSTHC